MTKVALRGLAGRKLRAVLTGIAIVLGVAMVSGTYILTDTINRAFTTLFTLNPPFYLDVADDRAFVPGFVSLILLYIVGFVAIRRMVDIKV